MDKIRKLLELIFQRGKMNIYRRVLRTALWGSCVTLVALGVIFLASVFMIESVSQQRAVDFAQELGDYLEGDVHEEVEDRLTETTVLRARLLMRLLEGRSLSVEFLAQEISDILQHENEYTPKQLPVANYEEVAEHVPYVYYSPELMKRGISPELSQEIAYVSAIENDIKRIGHLYSGSILAVSEHGYLIRMDMIGGDSKGAILCQEPLRSSYDFKDRDWYKEAIEAGRLMFTNPYMASYGKPCISVCAPYYDENGIAGVVVADIDTDYLCQRMKSSEVDGSNFSFVMDKEGNVIISPRHEGTFAATEMNHNLRKAEDKDLAETAERMAAGEHGIALVRADGEEYYLAFAPLSDLGWSMGTVIDKAQITAKGDQAEAYVGEVLQKYNADRKKFFLLMVAGAMLAFVIALYPILKANVKMAKGFADPINVLTDGVKEIAAGNLDRKLSIKTGDELEILADSFNRMTEDLAAHMESLASTTAQKERIETELSVGTRIQAGMLPDGRRPYAHRRDFELAAMMRPAREVGGDFYDFFFLDERHLVLTVADVSDKGVPAALFMVIAKTLLKENLLFAGGPEHLGEVFVKTNNALIRSNKENMFVTVFCGVLDTVTGEFAYVNAGHNPPVLRQQGKCRYLELAGYPVMGAVEDIPYSAERLNLQSGDAIFLYTDGVTEAMDAKLKLFGPQRLLQVLDTPGSSAEEEIEGVYEAVREYAGEAAQSDDITMLEMIYHGPERNKI